MVLSSLFPTVFAKAWGSLVWNTFLLGVSLEYERNLQPFDEYPETQGIHVWAFAGGDNVWSNVEGKVWK